VGLCALNIRGARKNEPSGEGRLGIS
jgi:hypothetical protein